ncbi:TPA: hypothetical protein ACRMZW_004307 [Pseudomonas aeruginosa]
MRRQPKTPEDLEMEEIERLEGIAQEQKMARTKGHARIALRHKGPYLEEALANFITLPRIAEDLAEQGVVVSVASLRKFLMEFLPDQYAEYLQVTGRGRKVNRAGAVGVGTTEEKKEVKPEAPSAVGNRKEEAATKETKPAATGEKSTTRIDSTAIGLSSEERKALADEEARRIQETYDKPRRPKS